MTADGEKAAARKYDYIVVGGGTAGCPLAATLSTRYSVLVVEREDRLVEFPTSRMLVLLGSSQLLLPESAYPNISESSIFLKSYIRPW
jgi:choline dehydrogenase-like flavoprotein